MYISITYLKGANMKEEELENRIDNALELDDLLSLPRGFHIAENVFGQEMYIWRETVGEGYSLMFRTHNKNELYIEDFNEDGQLINCRYEEVEMILVHLIPDHVNRRVGIRLRISVSSSLC